MSTTSGALSDAAGDALDARDAESRDSATSGSVAGGEDEASEAMTAEWRAINDVSAQQDRAPRPHRYD
jgi:hypothetical protein